MQRLQSFKRGSSARAVSGNPTSAGYFVRQAAFVRQRTPLPRAVLIPALLVGAGLLAFLVIHPLRMVSFPRRSPTTFEQTLLVAGSLQRTAYVNHYKPLTERRKFVMREAAENGLDVEFVDEVDKRSLTTAQMVRFSGHWTSGDSATGKPATMAHFLSHMLCLRRIAQNFPNSYALVLEDDAVLSPNFAFHWSQDMADLPDNGGWDLLFLGSGGGLWNDRIPWWRRMFSSKHVYLKDNARTSFLEGLWGTGGAARHTDSYVVTGSCARRIVEHLDSLPDGSFDEPFDNYLHVVIRALGLRVYWSEPPIVTQGSKAGVFDSET